VVGDLERGAIPKDEANKLREKLTNDALKRIDAMAPDDIRQTIYELQVKAKVERDIENKGKEYKAALRQSRTHEGEYQLR